MTRPIGKRLLLIGGAFFLLFLLLVGHPIYHIVKSIRNDRNEITEVPKGSLDDASRLDETRIGEVWEMPTNQDLAIERLAELLRRARAQHLKISIDGARHSMGGQTLYPDGIVIDTLPLHQMELDGAKSILHVQAGAKWRDVIIFLNELGLSVEVMQSNDNFSVGGSLSVNCHGWQFNRPPIASTIESFHLMLADGTVKKCSRTENPELFSLVLGGYGLFGIIIDVDLRVVPNERYTVERLMTTTSDFPGIFKSKASRNSDIAMLYGRLNVTPEHFLQELRVSFFHRIPKTERIVSALPQETEHRFKRAIFRGGAGSDYGKELRWTAEKNFDSVFEQDTIDRNNILYEPSTWFENRTKTTTDVLVECFVPWDNFESLVSELRSIIPRHQADLLNVTVRDVDKDKDTFLRYATQPMFSMVMLFTQTRDEKGEASMEALTQEIISAALRQHGRYYLPYRLHASADEFMHAYPQAADFFKLKRKYDPEEIFQNKFYAKYGRDVTAGIQ